MTAAAADAAAELDAYFRAYAQTLGDMDAPATAALWGEPGMMITDDFIGTVATRDELAKGLAGSYIVDADFEYLLRRDGDGLLAHVATLLGERAAG